MIEGRTYAYMVSYDDVADRVPEKAKKILRLRDESGKFNKGEVYYISDAEFQSNIKCANCVFYDADNKKCELVSEEGEPKPGIISPEGLCSLFNAQPPRIAALKWLWGRGDEDGIGPQRLRATAYMFTYAGLDEEPHEDLKEDSLIEYETVEEFITGRVVRFLDRLKE